MAQCPVTAQNVHMVMLIIMRSKIYLLTLGAAGTVGYVCCLDRQRVCIDSGHRLIYVSGCSQPPLDKLHCVSEMYPP